MIFYLDIYMDIYVLVNLKKQMILAKKNKISSKLHYNRSEWNTVIEPEYEEQSLHHLPAMVFYNVNAGIFVLAWHFVLPNQRNMIHVERAKRKWNISHIKRS